GDRVGSGSTHAPNYPITRSDFTVNRSLVSAGKVMSFFPVSAAPAVPAPAPAAAPIAAPLPPPAIPPTMAPSAEPPPMALMLRLLCDRPVWPDQRVEAL